MSAQTCSHIDAITSVKHPTKHECEECVKIHSSWVHLRTCQTCGVTLCCDSSPDRHAKATRPGSFSSRHCFGRTQGKRLYCFPDEAYAEY